MKKGLIIGSRGSRLALIQAENIVARIRKSHPDVEVSICKISTTGDRDQTTRLEKMGIGAFVKELEKALLAKRIDIAVHSLKDVPTELSEGLQLVAVPERIDTADILVARAKLAELSPGARIGTDSLRRVVQLKQIRPDLGVCGVRGNVDTRVRKVSSGEVDGVILAAASMTRLGWKEKITEYLPFLPAVGQGALVIEARVDDLETVSIISRMNDIPVWKSVMAERAFLRALGGGCRAPIAALGTVTGSLLKLEGMVASVTGDKILRASQEGEANSPDYIGIALAHKILDMGASDFIIGAERI